MVVVYTCMAQVWHLTVSNRLAVLAVGRPRLRVRDNRLLKKKRLIRRCNSSMRSILVVLSFLYHRQSILLEIHKSIYIYSYLIFYYKYRINGKTDFSQPTNPSVKLFKSDLVVNPRSTVKFCKVRTSTSL